MLRGKVWGDWSDMVRVVLAEMTQEEAMRVLEEHEGDGMVVVPLGSEPVRMKVWDCEYDGSKPCSDPDCRHEHEELVWRFEVWHQEEWALEKGEG